jgi:hypothetical protein
MFDDHIAVDKPAIADYTHTLSTISAELDNVVQSANGILNGVAEYFTTHHASVAFNEVHNLLMQGIDEGRTRYCAGTLSASRSTLSPAATLRRGSRSTPSNGLWALIFRLSGG